MIEQENNESSARNDLSPSPKKTSARTFKASQQTKAELGTVIEEEPTPVENPNSDQSARRAGNQTFKTMMNVKQRNQSDKPRLLDAFPAKKVTAVDADTSLGPENYTAPSKQNLSRSLFLNQLVDRDFPLNSSAQPVLSMNSPTNTKPKTLEYMENFIKSRQTTTQSTQLFKPNTTKKDADIDPALYSSIFSTNLSQQQKKQQRRELIKQYKQRKELAAANGNQFMDALNLTRNRQLDNENIMDSKVFEARPKINSTLVKNKFSAYKGQELTKVIGQVRQEINRTKEQTPENPLEETHIYPSNITFWPH